MRPHRDKRCRIDEPARRTDGRGPGHQHLATGLQQLFGDDEIGGRVGEDLESIRAKLARGLDQREDIRLQRVVMADNLKLHPVGREEIARHPRRQHGLFRGVAAGCVGQDMNAETADHFKELSAAPAARRLAAERHGDDLRARRADCLFHDGGRGVARRAEQQARGELRAVKRQHVSLPVSGRGFRSGRLRSGRSGRALRATRDRH